MNDKQEQLNNLRHSTAHLLAAAVMELWPDTLRTIGPSIDNGFYFDFEFKKPVSEEDLPKIEAKMAEILKTWTSFEREEVSKEEALKRYEGNPYKIELINEFSDQGQTLTFYKSGNYEDLCRGGHSENPSQDLGAFKLLSIAGAYWRGSEKNKMLTRIYGTAFPTKQELEDHLNMLEEAKKRDHKKLGKELDLFVFSDLVGGGLPLWTPKGTLVRELLDNFVWQLRKAKGYQKVEIPHITKRELYEASGHWDKFKNELFKITTREGHEFAMKPMNCPHHTQIFKRMPMSYRDLPQRYANTTMVYRDEQSGELAGLSRVRCITQDDAHVFCRYDQIKEEIGNVYSIVKDFYSAFGFELSLRLSLRDPKHPENYLGQDAQWESTQSQLEEFLKDNHLDYAEGIGEAAFYGPKIDFMTKDSLGRTWQVATIQLDVNMPQRFDLSYANQEGKQEVVAMVHAAVMGSIERFMSILIEHYAGAFPTWLAPVQVMIIPITERNNDYGQKLLDGLKDKNIRAELDTNPETMQAKIRVAQLQKIPYMIIIGDREQSADQISVRTRDGKTLELNNFGDFLSHLDKEVEAKS